MARHPLYNKRVLTIARNLRRRMTTAERKLWSKLRDDQLGVRFRRQMPIGPYVVDFVSIKARVIVELDGSQHLMPSQIDHDSRRTDYLSQLGYLVLRFQDIEFLKNSLAVIQIIKQQIDKRMLSYELIKTPPLSSPFREGDHN